MKRIMSARWPAVLPLLGLAFPPFAHATESGITELEKVEVVGVTPVHGVGLPKNKIPANVQTATDKQINRESLWISPRPWIGISAT